MTFQWRAPAARLDTSTQILSGKKNPKKNPNFSSLSIIFAQFYKAVMFTKDVREKSIIRQDWWICYCVYGDMKIIFPVVYLPVITTVLSFLYL